MPPRYYGISHRLCLFLVVSAALAFTAWFAVEGVAASGPLFVSPVGNDANACQAFSTACRTISAAVDKASAGDIIIIASGLYTESVILDKDLTLIGFGAGATVINQGRIVVSTATARIFDLAITNGYDDSGGALDNNMGVVTLGYTSIVSNHASYDGGGIYNYQGTLVLDHSIVANKSVVRDGGGILNNVGSVSISHSTIMSNTACNVNCAFLTSRELTVTKPVAGFSSYGGGIFNDLSSIIMIDTCTIVSNSAVTVADGIINYGTLVISNSTISGNGRYGLWSFSALTLTNVTLNNHVVEDLRSAGITQLKNTIIANTTSGSNCSGSGIISLGHNLASDNSCNLNASGDMTNTNPLLGPLQDNGGANPTHALLSGSPAINHGNNNGCPATDQRGIARPQGGICDIGAYEFVSPDTLFMPLAAR